MGTGGGSGQRVVPAGVREFMQRTILGAPPAASGHMIQGIATPRSPGRVPPRVPPFRARGIRGQILTHPRSFPATAAAFSRIPLSPTTTRAPRRTQARAADRPSPLVPLTMTTTLFSSGRSCALFPRRCWKHLSRPSRVGKRHHPGHLTSRPFCPDWAIRVCNVSSAKGRPPSI